ncbi:MAG: hypothetical protein J6T10_11995 [Methanobrevibacter sp.]|nr:hypothetical protein [Methanobrevibacter sp.]
MYEVIEKWQKEDGEWKIIEVLPLFEANTYIKNEFLKTRNLMKTEKRFTDEELLKFVELNVKSFVDVNK